MAETATSEAGSGPDVRKARSKRHGRALEIARIASEPLSRSGVRNTTLGDIGATMNMTGAHLLYYFESKTDLFLAALRVAEDDMRAGVLARFEEMPSARDRWQCVVDVGAPTGIDDSALMMWLEGWSLASHDSEVHRVITELEERWQQLLASTLHYGIDRGELPSSTDVDLVVEGVSALLDGLTLRVVVGYRPVDRKRALDIVAAFTESQLNWQQVDA